MVGKHSFKTEFNWATFNFYIIQLYNEDIPDYEILLSPSYVDNPINEDTEDSLYYDQVPIESLQYPDYYHDLSKDALESFYDSLQGMSSMQLIREDHLLFFSSRKCKFSNSK